MKRSVTVEARQVYYTVVFDDAAPKPSIFMLDFDATNFLGPSLVREILEKATKGETLMTLYQKLTMDIDQLIIDSGTALPGIKEKCLSDAEAIREERDALTWEQADALINDDAVRFVV